MKLELDNMSEGSKYIFKEFTLGTKMMKQNYIKFKD